MLRVFENYLVISKITPQALDQYWSTTCFHSQDYQVDLYLRQHWLDPRLQHPQLVDPLDLNDPNLVKAIWKPEVYFPNAKDAEFQYVTVPNVLVRIDPGGQILYMLR